MADIFHQFPIKASREKVFAAIAKPAGLDAWWTLRAAGEPVEGAEYVLYFGPEYDWRARVVCCEPDSAFEFELTVARADWMNARVGFVLAEQAGVTEVRFHHTGWPAVSEHFCISSFCWAMYLRLLKRYVEFGEVVPYEARLDA
jgi:uncharacterized protein YndB with AHSA1/START domain